MQRRTKSMIASVFGVLMNLSILRSTLLSGGHVMMSLDIGLFISELPRPGGVN